MTQLVNMRGTDFAWSLKLVSIDDYQQQLIYEPSKPIYNFSLKDLVDSIMWEYSRCDVGWGKVCREWRSGQRWNVGIKGRKNGVHSWDQFAIGQTLSVTVQLNTQWLFWSPREFIDHVAPSFTNIFLKWENIFNLRLNEKSFNHHTWRFVFNLNFISISSPYN